jgi:WD40 repeat protein
MAFGPDGRLWIAAGELVGWDGRGQDLPIPVASGPGDATHPTSLAVDGSLLAAGLSSGHVLLADSRDGRELRRLKPFNQEVASVGLGTDARIIVGSPLGEVRAIHAETGEVTLSLPAAHHDAVTAVAPGPRGWFATGSRDRTVKVWDPSGQLVMTLPQARPVRRVFWAEDGSSLTILAEGERGLRRWDLSVIKSELDGMGIEPALP